MLVGVHLAQIMILDSIYCFRKTAYRDALLQLILWVGNSGTGDFTDDDIDMRDNG